MGYINDSFATENKPSTSLSVYQCGWQQCDAEHFYGPAVRDHYVIHYIIRGKGKYFTGGKCYEINEGEGFLITPNESTLYKADSLEPWEYYWVGFHGTDAKKMLKLAGLGSENLVFSYKKDGLVKKHLSDLYYSSKDYAAREYAMIGHLYLFFSCIITQFSSINKPYEEYLQRAIQYIEMNYSYKITIADIANFVGIDRTYLYRIFKSELGCSIQDYLMHFKLSKAKVMLENQNLTITEISYSLGFNNVSHFSKTYKDYYGVSPTKSR